MPAEQSNKGNGDPILRRIDAIRRRVTFWRMGWGYLCLLLLVSAMVFAGVLLDHVLILQKPGRVVFFDVFVVTAAAILLLATVYPLVRRVGRLYIARRVEDENPNLGNSLISYLQVREDPHVPTDAKIIMGRRAASRVRSFEPERAVDFTSYARLGSVLFAVLALFLAYSLLSPKSTAVSISRLLRPRGDILPPTATRIVEVSPGPLYVIAGQKPLVTVRIDGVRPEGVAAVWDGQLFKDRRILLTEGEHGTWKGRFPAILEDGGYHIAAGDTRSERYEVRALPRPVVEQVELRVEPPQYTGLPPRTLPAGDLEIVQGTSIGMTARTSLAPATGHVAFGSGRRLPLDPVPGTRELIGEFRPMRSDTWAVHFETVRYPGGATFKNGTPLEYSLTVNEDEAPTVRMEAPPDGLAVEPDAVVRLVYTAQDDFGLSEIRLHHGAGGFYGTPAVIAQPRARKLDNAVWEWDLSELTLSPGQTIAYYLEAEDNRRDVPQKGRSQERHIVVAPEPGRSPEPPPARQEAEPETADEPPRPASAEDTEPGRDAQTRQPPESTEEEGRRTAEENNFQTLRDYVRRLREELGMRPRHTDGPSEPAREVAGDRLPFDRQAQRAPEGRAADGAPEEGRPRERPAGPGRREETGEPTAPRREGNAGQRQGAETSGQCGGECTGTGQGAVAGEQGTGTGAAPGGGAGAQEGAGEGPAQRTGEPAAGRAAASGSGSGRAAGQGAQGTGQAGRARGSATQSGGRAGASAGTGGQGVQQLPAPGPRENSLSDSGMSEAVNELERRLEADELPSGLLDELGMKRQDLRSLIERFKQRAAPREPSAVEQTRTMREPEGRILRGASAATEGMALRDAVQAAPPDELRSRFEGADEQLSTRYREVVDQYYKALSEEP